MTVLADRPARAHELIHAHAASRPDGIAIIDADGSTCSYSQYMGAIEHAVQILREHEAAPGDRIVIVAENCLATAVMVFACSVIGASAVPVNARMTALEIGRVIDHAGPALTLYTVGASPEASRHAAAAQAVSHVSAFGRFALVRHAARFQGADSAGGEPAHDNADAQTTAVILYTTGTTGAPKGVMLTHANLLFSARTSACLRALVPVDRVYGALPLTHVFGLTSMLMAGAHAGATVQLESRFVPARAHACMRDGVTVFPGVPQMHALLMQYTREQGVSHLQDSPLRYVSSGAAPLDPTWKRRAEAFYGIALQNGYGMTESTAGVCATSHPIGCADTSVGPPLPGVQIRLDTSLHASDGSGEILTRGPHVMKGYFRNAPETARVIDEQGWLRTGDLGTIDEHGHLHVVGRCKELIIRGGFNVYPPEIEAALNAHPDIVQSAVIGRSLDDGDEEILAFVQCVDPDALDTAALYVFVCERLASYKRPARIIPTTELPAAATGKVLKHRLLACFADRLATA